MNIEELVIEHAGWIRRKSHRYYTDENDADDLASETIYKCLCNGYKFNYGMNFKPWVLAIMENTYITQYNRRKCVLFTGYDEFDTYLGSERADQRASVNRILSIVRKCGKKSKCIECVMLYAKGYSYVEIADKISIPVGTVRSRVSAGRKMLRDALNG